MKQLKGRIESGRQSGYSKNITRDKTSLWCDAAIQKHQENYIVHVSVIKEENMAQEKYEVYFTRKFSKIDDAYKCVEENGFVKLNEFNVLKGQKIFNPNIIEEND